MEQANILEILNLRKNHYFSEAGNIQIWSYGGKVLASKDIVLYRVDEVTFEEDAPRKEALENVLSAVRIPGINFLYLIIGDGSGVKFYFGLSRNLQEEMDSKLSLKEIGDNILQASIRGNFRGCKVEAVTPKEKTPLLQKIEEMEYASRIEGVAGSIKDNEEFQSVDRLVDIMQGEEFCVLLVARALQPETINLLETSLQEAYSQLSPLSKVTLQKGKSSGISESKSHTDGSNESNTDGNSDTEGDSQTDTWNKASGSGTSTTITKSEAKSSTANATTNNGNESRGSSKGKNSSRSNSHSKTTGTSKSDTKQDGTNKGTSETQSREHLNKNATDWMKYCDDVLFPRLDYGKGKGVFLSAFYVLAKKKTALIKLENTAIALYSGKQGNRVPLRSFSVSKGDAGWRNAIINYQLPRGRYKYTMNKEVQYSSAVLSQLTAVDKEFPLCNWLTTNELSMLAGLPQKEVIGMRLREEVEFGLNYDEPMERDRIHLGNLVQNGNEVPSKPIYLDKRVLDKHIFIAGVTGSGKTTTCHKILLQSQLPFLVIEPAKTEYRILSQNEQCKDLLVFTLGNDTVAPFRLNPFEFMPNESITSHVDMIKASMEASFDMESAIPQLIEAILYRCYEDLGWDISTNKNSIFENPFDDDVYAFPTFTDMLNKIESVVNEQHFDERLKNDYIGSIRARLQSLTLGSKGLMLNTKRSIDFDDLLDRKVVLELENIKNANEKALIMGFILSAFNEAVRERYIRDRKPHQHIILVEEAHRLLSKFMPGDGLNKKQGVEAFTDMLAEIRKYGESLIIVDQIPDKLAPEVLKNTNTKIIHRIFAQDDKEAVGNTMALEEEQKAFLSSLNIGRAIMFSDNYGQAMQVQIKRDTSTTDIPLMDDELSVPVYVYYCEQSRRPIFMKPVSTIKDLELPTLKAFMEFTRYDIPRKMFDQYMRNRNVKWNDKYAAKLKYLVEKGVVTTELITSWIFRSNVISKYSDNEDNRLLVKKWLEHYIKGEEEVMSLINEMRRSLK